MINEITIIGRLGKDPEYKEIGADQLPMCKLDVAVNRPKQKDKNQITDWFTVVTWRGTAKYCRDYAKKGKLIAVHGAMQTHKYDSKDGKEVTVWDLQANKVEVLEYEKDEDRSYDKRESQEDIKMSPIDDSSLPF